jgi:dihydrofolate reductase
MIGVMLLSKDYYIADSQGNATWGPIEDKKWLHRIIRDQEVLIGYNTAQSIKKYTHLMSLASWVAEPSKDTTIHFGGLKTWQKYPPKIFIVHRTFEELHEGVKLPCNFFDNYKLLSSVVFNTYEELLYVKKRR